MTSGGELASGERPRLPASWDAERDVLLWIGPAARMHVIPRGARVLAWPLDGAAPDPGAADGPRIVRSESELFQAVLGLRGAPPAHVILHRCPHVANELAHTLAEALRGALRARAMQQKTVAEAGTTWLAQGLANLTRIAAHPSIVPLRGAFAGQPCILVSPGPSLAKNVHELRALAARALIVSGTHALGALARAGVTPHVVVCADPGDLARHWQGLDLAAVEAFVVGATCRAETFAVPSRRTFTFASNGALDAWIYEPLDEAPGLATGGSVACSMYSFALHLGCDPVLLVGQDLSFGERFYAEGGLDGDALVAPAGADEFVLLKPQGAAGPGTPLADGRVQFTIPQRVFEVPGWAGGTVRTTAQLKAFLDWFEAVAPTLAGRTRLVNATEGGARIRGFEHLPLAAVGAGFERELAVASTLDRACAGFDPEVRRARLRAWAQRTLSSLEECVRLARRCRANLAAGSRALPELARQEKRLSRALRGAPLVSLVAQDAILAARERARTARVLAENLAAAQSLYEVVERAGALLAEPLRGAARELA